MDKEQKIKTLHDLQIELMEAKVKGQKMPLDNSTRNPRLLRRMIAIIKTDLHMKGYSYHVR